MQRSFDNEDFQPASMRRDTELTLGPWLLTGLGVALLALCALCFGLGYRMGHGSAQTATATPAATAPQIPAADAAIKPSANTAAPVKAPPVVDESTLSEEVSPEAPPDSAAASSSTPSTLPVTTAQRASRTAPAVSTSPVVQIAAVSHREDADVLVNALRKRGYSVTISQDASDNLLHVRIGPFSSNAEANKWKQKLLNDGYNAIVQP